MKKLIKLLPLSLIFLLTSCNSGSTSQEIKPNFDEINYNSDLLWMPDLKIEVDQMQYMENYMLEFENSKLWIADETKLKFEDNYLVGLAEGETFIVYEANGQYKKVNVSIAPKGTYKRAYTFNSIADSLKDKYLCNFGDSLSFDCTLGDFQSTYPRRIASKFKMHEMGEKYQEYYLREFLNDPDYLPVKEEDYDDPSTYNTNYAVGGSTSLYPPYTSTLWDSYHDVEGFNNFYDGCDRIQLLYKGGYMQKFDLMFLTYGYNDLAFQPEIDADGDDVLCTDDTFACCHSFKGCWRYMINVARAANPNIKIVLMNMIYNQHDVSDHAGYRGLSFQDFRQAVYELGYEMDVKVIDPWNYMQGYYDYYDGRVQDNRDPATGKSFCYRDEWHPSVLGHKHLANFVAKW